MKAKSLLTSSVSRRFLFILSRGWILTMVTAVSVQAQQLAFPGAVGYGAYATGGRSGTVYHVTNLSNSGSGSFRDAVSQPNRTVVFDVGGVINITSVLVFSDNITVAGETAPGGIVVYGNATSLSSHHNIIVRYVSFRQGINSASGDKALNMTTSYNIVLDHVSVAWGRWDTFGITGTSSNITLQDCILAEGIDPQRFGGLIDGEDRITLARNLFINNQSRNPKGKGNLQYINNVVYNWGANGYCGGHSGAVWMQDLINNYFIAGPSSSTNNILAQFTPTDTIYNSGNYADLDRMDGSGNGLPGGRLVVESDFIANSSGGPSATFVGSPQNTPPVAVPIMSATDAYLHVMNNVGNSLKRDGVDQRLITDVRSLGTLGAIITSEAAVGGQSPIAGGIAQADTDQDGMPDYWESAMGSNPNNAGDRNNLIAGGYTALEGYFNWLSAPHAFIQSNTTANVDLNQYATAFTNPVYTVFNPTNGTVTLLGDGHTAQFTPTANYIGMASFSYSLLDQNGSTATDTVSVLVSPLAPPPLSPDAPSGLTATTMGTSQIDLSWSDNATNETGYAVERSTDNSTFTQIASLSSNTTSYSDTGLTPAKTYYYRVRASNTGGFSSYSNTAQATTVAIPALTWVGDGVLNRWDLATSTNWNNGVSAAVFSNAAAVTFDDTGSGSPAVTMVGGALAPLSVAVNASQTYTITSSGGTMSGSMGLTKSGSGQLILSGGNGYSGGTTCNAGTVTISSATAAGSGTITLNGGVLNNNATIANAITVRAPSTFIANGSEVDGAWRGNSTVNLFILGGQFSVNGSMGSFTGTFALGNSTALFRFLPNAAGSSNAVFDLGTASASLRTRNGNVTVHMGALIGGPNTVLNGASVGVSTTNASTFSVGNLNSNTTFSGTITEDLGRSTGYMTALTKIGTGALTLKGTNTFGGGTRVNGGTLLVDGIHRMWSNSTTVVANNGLLGGSGTVSGKVVNVQSGGALTPGDPVGTLTIIGGLTVNNSLLYFDLANVTNLSSNDSIAMQGGALTLAGTDTVMPNFLNGVLTNGTYTLISGGASTAGNAANLAWGGPTGTRQTFAFDTATAGTVKLNVTGNAATLSWTGINGILWDLNSTINWTNAGVADKFFNADAVIFDDTAVSGNVSVSGTVSPRSIVVSNSATPFTITCTNGVIAGTTSLIKQSDGLLTLSGSNTYSGGTTVSGGTLVLNSSSAAGTGTITLNGGTLTLGASIANALSVVAPSALNPGNNTLGGPVSGSSRLNVNVSSPDTLTLAGSTAGFGGTFALDGSTGFLQFNGSLGSTNAVFDLGTGSASVNTLNGLVTVNLGALTGGTNTTLSGATAASDPTAWQVGGKNTSTNFDGRITDGMGPTEVVKLGTGTWILTGTNNDYSGGTTVSNGTVLVNNTGGSGLGSGPVSVGSGASIGGHGIIVAPVSLVNGAILSPGGSVGTVTVDDDLLLSPSSVLQYELGTNGDLTVVTGNLTLGGVLNVADAGGFGVGTYPLFAYGTLTTNGTPGILTMGTLPNSNLTYSVDISSNGVVNLIVSGPVAGFSASPTNGVAPLAVNFTDTSTGVIANWFWDFGDGNTTNFAAATNPTHTYAAGTYSVTLVVTGPAGVSTNAQGNLITVVTPFQAWQQQYFGCTACPQAAANADPDGDGLSNLEEFLAGTNPTNGFSGLQIISTDEMGNDVNITWTTAGGRTNAVQATAGDVEGDYSTNFSDISGPIVVSGSGDTTTNYLDVGGVTNTPTRYYRIRLVP